MARSLHREWFVHFRFPGHENSRRVASSRGDIPYGWKAFPFEQLLVSMTGGDWGSEQPTEEDSAEVCIVRGTDFEEVAYGGKLRTPIRFIKPSSMKSRSLRVGDVIVENSINAKSRCIGTTLLVDEEVLARLGHDSVAASFCKVFRLYDPRLAPLVHLHLRHLREDARMEYYQNVAANGIGNFQAQKFAQEEHLILPTDDSLRSKLITTVATIFQRIGVLSSQLSNLRRTRDLLLPRLLSGQIPLEVSTVEDTAGTAAPARSETEYEPEEPVLRVAEESPPYHPSNGAQAVENDNHNGAEVSPMPIDQIDRTEVLQVIRQVFSEGPPRERDGAIRDVARALGYRRTGARIQEILHTDLLTAVRRGILENTGGELRLLTRSISDYERDFLKQQFLAAIGRSWIDRDDAIRDFCRWLGFARTGPVIEDTARSLINGLLREQRLEADVPNLIRRTT